MEESTKLAEKQQVARAIVKIYPRLRAETGEDVKKLSFLKHNSIVILDRKNTQQCVCSAL